MGTLSHRPDTERRGAALLLAHCANLDPHTATARERVEALLGPELAHVLIFALARPGETLLRRAV
jgi:hypothetical protein